MSKDKMIRRATWLKYLFAIATVILVLTLVISGFRTLTGDYFLERINQPTGFIVSSIDIQTSIPPSTAASQFTILADMFLAVIPMLGVCWNSYRFFDGLAKGLTPFADSLIKNLQWISLSLWLAYLLPTLLSPLISRLLTGSYTFIISVDTTLILAFIMSVVTEIFKYGAFLQGEVDETV